MWDCISKKLIWESHHIYHDISYISHCQYTVMTDHLLVIINMSIQTSVLSTDAKYIVPSIIQAIH